MTEKRPLPYGEATRALVRSGTTTTLLLARRRLHRPTRNLGRRLHFADGTVATVYRETVVERPPAEEPAVLVVGFRLRGVHGEAGHAVFRPTSVLNTPLFAGFPGFVSKLWLAHDAHGVYRGVYEWDGPGLAEDYVRALWRVLALVSVRGSIHYEVLPGLRRDEVLRDPWAPEGVSPVGTPDWDAGRLVAPATRHA